MPKPFYELSPNVDVVKGPYAPDSLIIIQANNMAFSDEISQQFTNSRIEDFIDYVKSFPIRYAFCNFQCSFYPKQVCEFYYSCSSDSDDQTITRTIVDVQYRVTINMESFQTALHLPQLENYFETPSEEKCKSVHERLRYNFNLQDASHDSYKYTICRCFGVGWKYLTGVIGNCLGHKIGSLDELNFFEQRILFSVVYIKRLDFAQLFLDPVIDCIIGNKKLAPYPCWLGLILARDEGYFENHGISIPIHAFS
ncbi:unnamed protein product [Lactuca saligna]|uniref:Uncharacterized protein n=1 Tax=Lactuca saligna TaxID=75948 RepID=A0AA35ZKE1_LACSI|nr:unnamed protein product [Lactuca saligna]